MLFIFKSLIFQKHRKSKRSAEEPIRKSRRPLWQNIVEELDRKQMNSVADKENYVPVFNLYQQYKNQTSDRQFRLERKSSFGFQIENLQPEFRPNADKCIENSGVTDLDKSVFGGQNGNCVNTNLIGQTGSLTDDSDLEEIVLNLDSGLGGSRGTKSQGSAMFSDDEMDRTNKAGSVTPKGTPIKNLPFSPSQVCYST